LGSPPTRSRKEDAVFPDGMSMSSSFAAETGLETSSGRTLDAPTVSVYKMRGGKIIEYSVLLRYRCDRAIPGEQTWSLGVDSQQIGRRPAPGFDI